MIILLITSFFCLCVFFIFLIDLTIVFFYAFNSSVITLKCATQQLVQPTEASERTSHCEGTFRWSCHLPIFPHKAWVDPRNWFSNTFPRMCQAKELNLRPLDNRVATTAPRSIKAADSKQTTKGNSYLEIDVTFSIDDTKYSLQWCYNSFSVRSCRNNISP